MSAVLSSIYPELILTAGPSITQREIDYVNDAVRNGWNNHHSDYIKKFEKSFCHYIDVKHAMTTSSCTGALHLALKTLGIKAGDEVIIPEITWIATAAAVTYVGAKPVFCDIEPNTWVIDPNTVEKHITPRTKAIMPVGLYGQPSNIVALREIANKHGLYIVEDAAPAIGAMYHQHKAGRLADIACFSFQGAKAFVTGEGGMLVTQNDEWIKRARFLNDHGRDPNHPLQSIEIGHKYKMSNIQAALGLAQIERAEEIIEKKRQIFSWYHQRLQHRTDIALNTERPHCRNIMWMTSIVLQNSCKKTRDEVRTQLLARNIDSRPFFMPLSSMPMFSNQEKDNPVSYWTGPRGINLPSGHLLTEEHVHFICLHLQEILSDQ